MKEKIKWSQLPWIVQFTTIVSFTYLCVIALAFVVGFILGVSGL